MASPSVPLSLTSPGYFGLNTQDSPSDIDQRFALNASNCIIDRSGRIAARKGWVTENTASADLGTAYVKCAAEITRNDGTTTTLVAGNNKLMKVSAGALVNLTYGGGGSAPTITTDDWQSATLNDTQVFFQQGYTPLIYDPAVSTTTYRRISERSGAAGTPPTANCVVSAYGRLWAADVTANKNIVYWSDTLAPHIWTGGSSGSLNLVGVWPSGGDQIVALAAHNNKLIIFGKKQTLIYSGADNPSTIALSDTLNSVGCVARDSVQNTDKDIIFLSDSGVLSLMRTIQENSAPVRTVSANVNDDIQDYISNNATTSIKSGYSPSESIYLLTFVDNGMTYCFDTKNQLENGGSRVTTWSLVPRCYMYSKDRLLHFGMAGYLGKYSGYVDNATTYRMSYYSTWIDFGRATALSILKKILLTIIGSQGQTTVVKWGFDYLINRSATAPVASSSTVAEYGIAEYGVAEYYGSTVSVIPVNAGGSGKLVQIVIEAEIIGYALAIQKVDIYTKEGRI